MRFILCAVCIFLAAHHASALVPELLLGGMDKTFYSSAGPVFRVKYASCDVVESSKIMKVSVPTHMRLNGLGITAFTRNITDAELNLAKTKIPFTLSAAPFSLRLEGRRTVVISADRAVLTPVNTIYLKGRVRIAGDNTVPLADEAFLSLSGRTLMLEFSGRKIALKF